jgi:hypothetical protein
MDGMIKANDEHGTRNTERRGIHVPCSSFRVPCSVFIVRQAGPFLALESGMGDNDGATEEQNVKIDAIVGDEALGYEGSGREENSGQNSPDEPGTLADRLADNRPDQVK